MVGVSHLEVPLELHGRRVELRTLTVADYEAWHEVRVRCREWLLPWEPRAYGEILPEEDRISFAYKCQARERERQMGAGYGFGIFFLGAFVGEISLSSIQRGPFQSAMIGYWIDKRVAGQGLMPEAVVVVMAFAFEELGLHRLEIAIIPRNRPSRRVVEKLELREEGVALRYLEIDGVWEDHIRYAITVEEWAERRDSYMAKWF